MNNLENIFLKIKNKVKETKNEEELRVLLVENLKQIEESKLELFFLERDRIDIKYKDVVIETKFYKRINENNNEFLTFENQTKKYMQTFNIPYGVLTDCNTIYFYKIDCNGVINRIQTNSNEFNLENFKFLLNILFDNNKDKYLVSSNLIYDFGNLNLNDNMKNFLKQLLNMFENSENAKKELFFTEWEKLFRLSESDKDDEFVAHEDILKRRIVLEKIFDIEINKENEYKSLFILYTALSIIIKLLILNLMKNVKNNKIQKSLNNIVELKQLFRNIELGYEFEMLGVLNMGKSDFFSWYIEIEWSYEFINILQNTFLKAVDYKFTKWKDLKDPIKDLYENYIAFDIRHSLGEYYTPQGLADYITNKTIDINDRVIDPTCGSGTFITSAIKLKNKSLTEILNNYEIIGIDLNPIAVIMAKLTFLLNTYHLMKDENILEIEIPIYLGDSSYLPTIVEINGTKYIEYQYYLDNSIINIPTIIFPLEFVKHNNFIKILNEIEEMIFDNKKLSNIQSYLISNIKKYSVLDNKVEKQIKKLLESIIYYHKQNLNTIWLFIFMNYLKPFALAPFDKAIGNPPWVRWSVLPIEYKKRIKNTLRDEGLFSSDKNVGGIDLNICALIANRVLDNILKINGNLIFLMPESILYNKSFEGFRKLNLHNARGQLIEVFKPKKKVFKEVNLPFLIYNIKKIEI